MNRQDWNLWSRLTFKTLGYRKNFDLVSQNENIITHYDGMISEIKIGERKPPSPVGEYGFSVWNIGLAKRFKHNIHKLIKDLNIENTYSELINVIKKGEIDIKDYNKIVFVHTFILNKKYRKSGITEELIEMLYRDFYCEGVGIIMLVKPFQDNAVDSEFYCHRKKVIIREKFNDLDSHSISAREYYSLDELMNKKDTEMNEYKLFSVAKRCGFERINESFLFVLSPEKVIERMIEKENFSQLINIQ